MVSKALRCVLHKFRMVSKALNICNMRKVYYDLVHSVLQYGILAWGTTGKITIKKAEIPQKRFLKIMQNKSHLYPAILLYKECKVPNIKHIYAEKLVISQYRNKHTLAISAHIYSTR